MRKLYAAVLAVVLLAGFVLPATASAPAHFLAKKALRTAKSANSKASAALGGLESISVLRVASGDVFAPPGGFADFDVPCPAGSTAVGFDFGLGALEPVAVLSFGQGYLGSYFNPSETESFSGTLAVNCLAGVGQTGLRGAKAGALAQINAAKAAHR